MKPPATPAIVAMRIPYSNRRGHGVHFDRPVTVLSPVSGYASSFCVSWWIGWARTEYLWVDGSICATTSGRSLWEECCSEVCIVRQVHCKMIQRVRKVREPLLHIGREDRTDYDDSGTVRNVWYA